METRTARFGNFACIGRRVSCATRRLTGDRGVSKFRGQFASTQARVELGIPAEPTRAVRVLALSGLALVLIAVGGCGFPEPKRGAAPPVVAENPLPVAKKAATQSAASATVVDGPARYRQHCAACHGDQGDGNGLAARFLYPKPRNFREGRFRFVTTSNTVPSDNDLDRVLTRGLPGSAMFPFGHLPQEERQALINVVKAFVHDGVVDRVKKEAAEFNEEVKPEELATALKNRMEPGPRIVVVPADLPKQDKDSEARGRELYVKSCATCHGDTGKGDGVQEQRDEFDVPIRPRDFTRGIFKGGRDRDQLYARITLGVPGTSMPASPQLKPSEVGDMINYILSLSDPATAERVEHKRTRIVARKLSTPLGEDIADSAWNNPSIPIVISPLWWRDGADPDLHVQAIHDGQTLAIRLTWRDATRNETTVRPQDFADMAAAELFQGDRTQEPFLGMGAHDGAVDLWLWNAAAQADRAAYADVDSTYPHMSIDVYPFEKTGDTTRPHATERQPKEFLSAWAAGNQRSDPTHVLPGSNLQARGFGSTTLQPRTSQLVVSNGQWRDGTWSVVLRRPLLVASEAGIPLEPGQRRSIAFAVWDGAARDRNGQKLVSIWHDLELE